MPQPSDQQARDQALDTTQSWIVQAPAGAGKTELLTARFLALLAEVDEPEEILAHHLHPRRHRRDAAKSLRSAPGSRTRALTPAGRVDDHAAGAASAGQRSRAGVWQLLEQPHRLDIQTIDALAARFAHSQPLLARLGGRLDPSEDAGPMYAQAARRTLARLDEASELSAALRHLLLLRDNNLADATKLIAGMLAHRDQWAHILPLSAASTLDWTEIRARLERPFAQAIERTLTRARELFAGETVLVDELLELGSYACSNENNAEIHLLAQLRQLPPPQAEYQQHWLSLANLLLTKDGGWRKRYSKNEGFPTDGTPAEKAAKKAMKDRMEGVIEHLNQRDDLLEVLGELRGLPAPRYDELQWRTLQAIFRVLRQAAAELRVVFAERNQVDFMELALSAEQVLAGSNAAPLATDAKRHLLIDEFQDTSRRQHTFLSLLLREWAPGDGRTVFLVGDPMQSIYLFRQAEYELFHHVQQHGIPCGPHTHACSPLALTANFRSHSGLVKPLNEHFNRIFAGGAAVPFAPAEATERGKRAVHVHPFFERRSEPESRDTARADEARAVVDQVRRHLLLARQARVAGAHSYTIAVLVRTRPQLSGIIALLREEQIPYRAIDIEALTDRQEILDLLSLTRALLLPGDRLAWLSVLRAPWCGLTLTDLHLLAGDDRKLRFTPVAELIATRAHLLSTDGQARLARISSILTGAIDERFAGNRAFATWIEQTWRELHGPSCLSGAALENVRVFFRLLDQVSPDGMAVLSGDFKAALGRLCAEPDLAADEHFGVQLLTIHKSKGLGFDVVLVPGLERGTSANEAPLVTMLERFSPSNLLEEEILLAPIGGKGARAHSTYDWIQKQRMRREDEERKRLVYVACTRARKELHLFGTATVTNSGALAPGAPKSLLNAAWPALQPFFEDTAQPGALPFPTPFEPAGPAQPGLFDIAAAAETQPRLLLRRLPAESVRPGALPPPLTNVTVTGTQRGGRTLFERPEGSRAARAHGNAVHALLEQLAAMLAENPSAAPIALRPALARRATQVLREAAFTGAELARLSAETIATALEAAAHPEGRWTLHPHPGARSEEAWTQWSGEAGRTLRADRVFLAGAQPLSFGTTHLWIVDYKTGVPPTEDLDRYLAGQEQIYRNQLESYGEAARQAGHAAGAELRYALYFPHLRRLHAWAE